MPQVPSEESRTPCPLSVTDCRALRDSTAFQLTYCLGRAGFLQPGEVVGHPSASLAGSSRSGTRGWAVAPESGDGAAACGPAAPPPDGTAPTSPTSTSAQVGMRVCTPLCMDMGWKAVLLTAHHRRCLLA